MQPATATGWERTRETTEETGAERERERKRESWVQGVDKLLLLLERVWYPSMKWISRAICVKDEDDDLWRTMIGRTERWSSVKNRVVPRSDVYHECYAFVV